MQWRDPRVAVKREAHRCGCERRPSQLALVLVRVRVRVRVR